MTSRIDLWFEAFQKDPDTVWKDCVDGWRPIPDYERADLADTLDMVFGGRPQDDPLTRLLDQTLTTWMEECVQWDAAQRREFGFARTIHCLVEVMSAAFRLRLPTFRQYAFENLVRLRGLLDPLVLAPSHDPVAALYRILAGSEQHAGRLETFWLGLCKQADDQLPGYYLNIGMMGLRHCQSSLPKAALPCVGGLAAWLPNAPGKDAFVSKFRAMRYMYPQNPGTWSAWIEPILEARKERVDNARLEWWRHELEPVSKRKVHSQAQSLKSPYPKDLVKALEAFDIPGNRQSAEDGLKKLFDKHDQYVTQTGDSYYFVRAVGEATKNLLGYKQAWMAVLALRLVRRALVLEPWNPVCWLLYGRCLTAIGRAPEAAEWAFWESIRRFPNNLQNYTELGRLLAAQGRNDEAEEMFRSALKIDPKNLPPRTELGRLFAAQGRNDEAEEMFRAALKIDSNHLHSHTELGRLFITQGRKAEAEEMFRSALKIDPKNPHCRMELDRLLAATQHRKAEAEEIFPVVLASDKNDACLPSIPQQVREVKKRSGAQESTQQAPRSSISATTTIPVLSPDHDQENLKSIATSSDGDESACFDELRPPALAKRADFFLSSDASNQNQDRNQMVKRVQKEFQELVDKEANHGVVQFFAFRHGLRSRNQDVAGSACVARDLEDAANDPDALVRAEKLQNVAKKLSGRLTEWVRIASGDTTLWPQLLKWQQQQPSGDQEGHASQLSHQDVFVLSEVTRWLKSESTVSPPEAVLLASMRRAAEMLLPASTDPVQEEYILAKSRMA